MAAHVAEERSPEGPNPREGLIAARSSRPPQRAGADRFPAVYVLDKLSKTNRALGFMDSL